MRSTTLLAYGAIVAATVAVLAALSPSAFSIIDLRVEDAMVRGAETRPPSGRVVIVSIDDRSLSEVGQWPWPRDVLARLIDAIRGLGARAVALDLLLAEPDRFGAQKTAGLSRTDSQLAATLAAGRVVMSYAFTFDPGASSDRACVLHPLDLATVETDDGRSPLDHLFHATGVTCSLPPLNQSAGASGYLNASVDRDGLLRRVPLVSEFRGQVYPSLAFAAVLAASRPRGIALTSAANRAGISLDGRPIALDEQATLLVRFRGGRGTYPQLPAAEVLAGRVRAGSLDDRIVFVGATALGVQDVVATPYDNAMRGIEVHAAAADTLLQGDYVSSPPAFRSYELGLTLVLGFGAAVLVAVLGFTYGSAACAVLLAFTWWTAFWLVDAHGVFLSPVFPTVGVGAVLVLLTIARVRHERRRAESERGLREHAQHFVVQSLTSLMETRDGATGRHARRTRAYSKLLATRLAPLPRFRDYLTPERIELLSQLSPLHDLGKVGVRDAVLNKAGPLSDDERVEMRQHPSFAYETIARAEHLAVADDRGDLRDESLFALAKDIVYTHHERWDGHGYPRGLKGDEIPIAGRIVALVDVYDALTNARIYRGKGTHEQAVTVVAAGRGTHFDPDVVDAFLDVQDRFRELGSELGGEEAPETAAPPAEV